MFQLAFFNIFKGHAVSKVELNGFEAKVCFCCVDMHFTSNSFATLVSLHHLRYSE